MAELEFRPTPSPAILHNQMTSYLQLNMQMLFTSNLAGLNHALVHILVRHTF